MKTEKLLLYTSYIIKGIILLLPLILGMWLLEKNYAFSGKRVISYDFSTDSEIISHLEPWQRLSPIEKTDGDYSQKINDDIVYFSAKRDISFEKVTVQLTYQNTGADIINIGMRINDKDGYKKIPLESTLIDTLDWSKTELENGDFYQKTPEYQGLDDFIHNPPRDKKILVHHYNLPKNTNLDIVPKENFVPLRSFTKADEYDYLLTDYHPPKTIINPVSDAEWKVAQNTFLYGEAFKDKENNVRFSIDTPGLKENNGNVRITDITLTYEKPALSFQKITEKIASFFNI